MKSEISRILEIFWKSSGRYKSRFKPLSPASWVKNGWRTYLEGESMVEKVACEIKCIETENGFRIEVTGERAKKYLEKLEKGEISCPQFCGCC